jgi:predicted membrane-bound spermidine synthase
MTAKLRGPMSLPSSADSGHVQARHFAGLFLLSLATLLLELALTRVLSVSLWYHFGFLVISTALLGFGASGVALALWTGLRERIDLDLGLGVCGLAFAVCTLFSFWCMQRIPFDPFSVAVDHRQLLFMPIYFLLVALPFFCSGLAISLLLTRGSKAISRLYGYDLLGAGAGCALVALVIPRFGGSGSVLMAAFVGALSGVCFAWTSRRVLAAAAAFVSLVLLAASFRGDKVVPIHVSANKNRRSINSIYSAWNTLSLVQVVEYPPEGKDPAARMMFIDSGTAATGTSDLRPDCRRVLTEHPDQVERESTIAYVGKANPKILIIGSGGGAQVLAGLQAHASSITAIEINSIINDIVANRMNDFWGNLYHQPEVHLITDEGRSFVRRSADKYDAIISVHTISNAAVASGALSLAESYVLTREAFEDYLDHLSPDGTIFFTRPEFQIPRLLSTAREVFERRGMGSIANHVFAFSEVEPRPMPGRLSFVAGFLLKKSEFSAAELNQIRGILNAEAGPGKDIVSIKTLYAPDERPTDILFAQIVGAPSLEEVFRNYDSQLAAATDDKPFFNQHTRWSRIRWSTIVDLFSQKQPFGARLALEDRPIAEVTLLILLVQSAIVAGLCILLPLVLLDRRGLQIEGRWGWLGYFAALGLGFIMVEIALLQRFLLFLGQPIYTYAVVLAGLLVFTGIGSHAAGSWGTELHRILKGALLCAIVLVIIMAVITPAVFSAALGLSISWRIVIALLLVAPLGFVLGIPFPLGLRLAMQRSSALGSWAWGVNGFFTVIGTVLALILGMMIGFRIVLLLACACYLGGLLTLSWLSNVKTEGDVVALRHSSAVESIR